MFIPNDFNEALYSPGTFKLGQKICSITNKEHRFRVHKKCEYCNSTGIVTIKDGNFRCPACQGEYIHKTVTERIVNDCDIKIGCVISLKNKNNDYEYYTTGTTGSGLQIHKHNGEDIYFDSKESAQKACDKFNAKNNVQIYLQEYTQAEIRGYL